MKGKCAWVGRGCLKVGLQILVLAMREPNSSGIMQQVEVKNGEQGGDGGQSINPISRLIQIQQVCHSS